MFAWEVSWSLLVIPTSAISTCAGVWPVCGASYFEPCLLVSGRTDVSVPLCVNVCGRWSLHVFHGGLRVSRFKSSQVKSLVTRVLVSSERPRNSSRHASEVLVTARVLRAARAVVCDRTQHRRRASRPARRTPGCRSHMSRMPSSGTHTAKIAIVQTLCWLVATTTCRCSCARSRRLKSDPLARYTAKRT